MGGTLTLFLNEYQDYELFIKYQVITTEYNPNALQCSKKRLPLDKDNVIQRSFSIFERVCQRTFQFFLLNFQLLMYSIGQVFAHSGELVQKNTNQVQADVGSEHMYRIVATEKKRFFDFHLITMC